MKIIYTLLILLLPYFSDIFSQSTYKVEISEGFIFFDYFGNEPEKYDNVFAGYGLQTEIDVWRKIYMNNSIVSRIGLGFSNYYYLANYGFAFVAEDLYSTSYINLKLGIDYNPNWSKLIFVVNFTNYFLPYIEKQKYSQNRWFANLDFGLRIKLLNKIELSVWTPLTIYPMYNGKYVRKPIEFLKNDYDPWIEITGLNIGISYGFGGGK